MASRWRDAAMTLGIMAIGAVCVGLTRPLVSATHEQVKVKTDVYVLPPPKQLSIMSMGYRSAVADILWSHVLVAQGLRLRERRRFDTLTKLLEAIIELDPNFRRPYLLADSLITFQAAETPFEEVVKAREILELGTKNHPYDAEIWLVLGQFVAFLAPAGYIEDEEIREQWRRDGAKYLARAAELGGDARQVGWGALGGAAILNRAGEREAAISFYRRALAVTDDEELKRDIRKKLDLLLTEDQKSKYDRRREQFRDLWLRHTPGANRTMVHVLAPYRDTAKCAGFGHDDEPECAGNWTEWASRVDAQGPRPSPPPGPEAPAK